MERSKLLNDFDVVIVGAGPAGASAAIHLAARGVRVLLAEQKRFPRAKLCGEFISPECLSRFERLGVKHQMMTRGGAELTETVFYARGGASVNVPSAWFGAGGASALGLSRAEMDERLLVRAREAGAEVLEDAQAMGAVIESGRVRGVRLRVGSEARVYHSLVTIDASGRSRSLARRIEQDESANDGAPLKERQQKKRQQQRARLVAFKAHLEGARGAHGHCEIYFYRGGYGGLSSVENGLSNLCFIAAVSDVRACASDPERVMREVIATNRRAAYALELARVKSEWLSVALESFGRHTLVPFDGLLTVGDAASFIDPFTGSGMLMALESGELAAGIIASHLQALRADESFRALATNYRARYAEKFNARLRVCAMLRRAAFVPRLAETAIFALGASARVRRRLARATRRTDDLSEREVEKL